jgi:hypothetical protein
VPWTNQTHAIHTPEDLLPAITIWDFSDLYCAVGTFGDAELVPELVAVQGCHVQERVVVLEGTGFADVVVYECL